VNRRQESHAHFREIGAHDRGEGDSFADRRSCHLATAQKAEKNRGPAYDLGTETKVKGTIESETPSR
jgi:hypothetical protein